MPRKADPSLEGTRPFPLRLGRIEEQRLAEILPLMGTNNKTLALRWAFGLGAQVMKYISLKDCAVYLRDADGTVTVISGKAVVDGKGVISGTVVRQIKPRQHLSPQPPAQSDDLVDKLVGSVGERSTDIPADVQNQFPSPPASEDIVFRLGDREVQLTGDQVAGIRSLCTLVDAS